MGRLYRRFNCFQLGKKRRGAGAGIGLAPLNFPQRGTINTLEKHCLVPPFAVHPPRTKKGKNQ
jgi:hypothetical protein